MNLPASVLQTVAPKICRIRDNVLSWHKAAGRARFVGVRASELQTCETLNLALHFEFQEGAGARSLVSQRINGIEQRGFAGRIIAEENPDRGAKEESDQDGFRRDEGRPALRRGNGF